MKRALTTHLEPVEPYHAIQISGVNVEAFVMQHPPLQVDGDGNCFWYAIATGLQDTWEECKKTTLDVAAKSDFVMSCYDSETIKQQVQTCAQENEWANELMVVAAAHAFNRYMVVADRQGILYAVGDPNNPVLAVYFDMNHYQSIVGEDALASLMQLVKAGKQTPMFNGRPGVRLRGGGGRHRDPTMCVLDEEAEGHWLVNNRVGYSVGTTPIVKMMAANLTSMRTNLDAALELEPTILVVSETKVGPPSVRAMERMLLMRGYTMVAQCAPFAGDAHAQKSGVAVLVKAPYSVRAMEESEVQSDTAEWTQEGRLLHSLLLGPEGNALAVIVAVYSDVRVRESTSNADSVSRLCSHLEEFTIMQGKLPVFVAGDFNLGSNELPAFTSLVEGDALRDVHQNYEAHPRIPTMVKGTRVNDYVLANPAACELLMSATTVTTARIPVHRPLVCDLQLGPSACKPRLVLPHELIPSVKPDSVCGDSWFIGKLALEEAIRACDPDQVLFAWSTRWEAYLRHHALEQGQKVNAAYLGRGSIKAWAPHESPPVVNVGKAVFDSYAVRKISNLMSIIAKTLNAGAHSPFLEDAMQTIRARVATLGWNGWEQVEYHELNELYGDADGRLLHQRRQDKQQRIAQWKRNMSDDGDPTCRKTCQYVRGTSIQPLAAVTIDAKPVTQIDQIDAHLIEYWNQVGGDVVADVECAEEYIDHWCRQDAPFHLPEITTDDVLYAWSHAKQRASPGFGGWTTAMLRMLPRAAAAEMATLFNMMERVQRAPAGFRRALVALIPKVRGPVTASSTRPISVLPSLARCWSSIRTRHLQGRLIHALSPHQHGGIPLRSAQEPVANLLSQVARAELGGDRLYGVQIDFAKFFDSITIPLAMRILMRIGIDEQWASFAGAHYGHVERYFRFTNARLGTAWSPRKGLMQGDALSVALANLCVLPLARHLEHIATQHQCVWFSFFVDDLIVTSSTREGLMEAIRAIEAFVTIMHVNVNVAKCVYFGIGDIEDELHLCGLPLSRADAIKYLGYNLSFSDKGDAQVQETTSTVWTATLDQLRRVGWLPCDTGRKARIIGMGPMPKWTYDVIEASFDRRAVVGQRRAVMRSIRGSRSVLPSAAPEIALSFMHPLHRVDPPMVRGVQLIKLVRRMMTTLPPLSNHDLDRLARRGPLLALSRFCEWAGIDLLFPELRSGDLTLRLDAHPIDHKKWLHELRSLLRQSQLCALQHRRPGTFAGIEQGISRVKSFQWIVSHATPKRRGLAWLAQTGSLLTPDREHRYRMRMSAQCTHCGSECEDLPHILLACPKWAGLRQMDCTGISHLTATTLLVPEACTMSVKHTNDWMAQALTILEAWFADSIQQREQAPVPRERPLRASSRPTPPVVGTQWEHLGHKLQIIMDQSVLRVHCSLCGARPKYSERYKLMASECVKLSKAERDKQTRRFKFSTEFPQFVIDELSPTCFLRCTQCNASWKQHGCFARAREHASLCQA